MEPSSTPPGTISPEDAVRLLEALPDAVALFHEQRVVLRNAAWDAVTGTAPGAGGGQVLSSLVHPADLPLALERWQHASQGLRNPPVPLRLLCGTAPRLLEVNLNRVSFPGMQDAVVAVARDMRQRHESQTRLMLADRLASVGQLASGVAHEVNNPLTFVLSNLDLLAEALRAALGAGGVPDFQDMLALVQEAREGAARVGLVVRDLGALARSDDGAPSVVDVQRLADAALTLTRNEVKHRATVIKEFSGVTPVYGHEARLLQLILNLILNAAQAIPEGAAESNTITVSVKPEQRSVLVEVRDTGVGIPRESQQRVFEPFYTTKPAGQATGLGLTMCQAIVASHGGEITLESQSGVGTTVRVRLPLVDLVPSAATMPTQAATERRARVLVLDDDAGVRRALERVLSSQHEVTCLPRAAQALELLSRDSGFDVILCDILMPEMNGVEFHAELARRLPALLSKVVFMTGAVYHPVAERFLASVRNLSLEKPLDPAAVRAVVQRKLGDG